MHLGLRQILIGILILTQGSIARAMELHLWRPHDTLPALVLAVRDGETVRSAADRYLHGLRADEGLRDLLERSPLPHLPLRNFSKLGDEDLRRRVLLIANRPEDFEAQGNWRIDSFQVPLRAAERVSYLVPFAADVGFTAAETGELVQKLDAAFPAMVAMGGDDIDLRLMNRSIEGSKYVNGRRDRFEKALLERKIRRIENGSPQPGRTDRLFAVCRGNQFVGQLMGLEVRTHIDNHGGHSERPQEGNAGGDPEDLLPRENLHTLELRATPAGVLSAMIRDHRGPLRTNTYHHQCLMPAPTTRLKIAAVNPEDGCIEAVESVDGNVLGVQGHPELMAVRSHGAERHYGINFMKRAAEWLTPHAEISSCELALK